MMQFNLVLTIDNMVIRREIQQHIVSLIFITTLSLLLKKPGNISTLVLTDFSKSLSRFDRSHHCYQETIDVGSFSQPSAVFLTDRRQRVKYKSVYSDWICLTGGVPQVTLVGPVSILINDDLKSSLCDFSRPTVWKYVDDLTIGENRSVGDKSNLQEHMNTLQEWSDLNKLKLNPSKCQAMQIYFGKNVIPDVSLNISDQRLEVVSKVKLLGVMIKEDLKWDSQVESIQTKANQKMFMLRKCIAQLS